MEQPKKAKQEEDEVELQESKTVESELDQTQGSEQVFVIKPTWWNRFMPSQFKTLITGFAMGTGATVAGIFNQATIANALGFGSTALFNLFILRDVRQAKKEADDKQLEITQQLAEKIRTESQFEAKLGMFESHKYVKPTTYTAITLVLAGTAVAAIKLTPVFLSDEVAKDSQLIGVDALAAFSTSSLLVTVVGMGAANCIRLRTKAVEEAYIELTKNTNKLPENRK